MPILLHYIISKLLRLWRSKTLSRVNSLKTLVVQYNITMLMNFVGIAMDEQIRQAAVAAAHQLLLRYKAAHPGWTDSKTPVDDLVSWLGLHVESFHPNDYPRGTYGFLEPGEDLIWLCRSLPELSL